MTFDVVVGLLQQHMLVSQQQHVVVGLPPTTHVGKPTATCRVGGLPTYTTQNTSNTTYHWCVVYVVTFRPSYASPCHLTPPRPATPPYPPPQHEDPIISTMTIVTMNPVEREHKFKIHACRHFMNTLYSINKGNSACPSCTMP